MEPMGKFREVENLEYSRVQGLSGLVSRLRLPDTFDFDIAQKWKV